MNSIAHAHIEFIFRAECLSKKGFFGGILMAVNESSPSRFLNKVKRNFLSLAEISPQMPGIIFFINAGCSLDCDAKPNDSRVWQSHVVMGR